MLSHCWKKFLWKCVNEWLRMLQKSLCAFQSVFIPVQWCIQKHSPWGTYLNLDALRSRTLVAIDCCSFFKYFMPAFSSRRAISGGGFTDGFPLNFISIRCGIIIRAFAMSVIWFFAISRIWSWVQLKYKLFLLYQWQRLLLWEELPN